jgi:hypothetical protein
MLARLRLESLEARDTPAAITTAAAGAGGLFPRVVGLNPDLSVRFTSSFQAGSPSLASTGTVRVATGDLNGDGTEDVVAVTGPGVPLVITEYDGTTGAVLRTFSGFDPRFTFGLNVAVGDVDGTGRPDIIVGTATGSSLVAVLDPITGQIKNVFTAIPGYSGGVTVAAGDVQGTGRADIIVGTATGLSIVGVFNGQTGNLVHAFLAFGTDPVGVNVGFANGDILTGAATGAAFVSTFTSTGHVRLSFLAAPPPPLGPGGVRVAGVGDLILANVGPSLITFNRLTGNQVAARFLFNPITDGPVFVG